MAIPIVSDRWRRLAFRLPALIALFAAIAGLVSGAIAYYVAYGSYVEQAKERMELVRNERARAVTALIDSYRIGLSSLVTRPGIGGDIVDFSVALREMPDVARQALIARYTTSNPYPADSRAAITDAGDTSAYTQKHRQVHQRFLRLLRIKDLDDLMLVDTDGNVVYTVMKEADFGTNLLTGPYAKSNAARVFRDAIAAQPPWLPALADMEFYGASQRPAMFMAQAIRDDAGIVSGVLIFQLNNARLRDTANHIQDLGETGEVYLVGADATRRSQTRFAAGQLLTEKIDTEAATRAAAGFTSSDITTDYKGDSVVAAYAPINLLGVHWGIVSKIDLDEALAPLHTIVLATAIGVILSTLLIAYMGYAIARRISRPLDRSLQVMEKLSRGDLAVEIEEEHGLIEARQIGKTLNAFRASLIETRRLVSEVTDSQSQLTGLLDSSPTGILVISEDGEVLFVNDPGALILEKRKSGFIGEKFSFVSIAVREADAARIISSARRDGVVKDAQLAIRGAEGNEIVLSLTARRTVFKSREAFLVWFLDITEALRANADLRELSTRFVTLMENIPDLTTIQDLDLRFQAASQSVATAFGLHSWRDVVGKSLREVWAGDPASVPAETISEGILAGRLPGSAGEHQDFLQADRWLSTSRIPIRDEVGKITGLLSISRDVSEQKQLRDQLEQALAEAKDAQVRTAAILAGAPDSILIVQADSTIEYANEQIRKVLGYAPEELIGQRIDTLIPERFRIGHLSEVRGYFDDGEVRRMGPGRELFARAKDGREIPVEIALSPIRSGARPVVVAIVRDISEQKAAEKIVLEARMAAEAATRAKSDFLASMSHEIRTPMNGIIGMADLLAQAQLNDDQMHMIRTIRESGNALITVINDILDLSKIESGKLNIEDITMSIADAVEGVAATLTSGATQKGLRIHVFVDPTLPAIVHGDPTRLRQILFNLGGNAVKFSDGKDVRIVARPVREDESGRIWVRFSVIDQGIGISIENQAKLFKTFSQAESSTTRKYGGTGLGLAICKNLAEMMGGTISVTSELGQGSTFAMEMPFRVAPEARSVQKPRDLTGLHIVLVGSDKPRSEAILAYLRHAGAETSERADTDAVLRLITSEGATHVDSLMLDLGLSRELQDEAVQVIRKATGGKIKLILLQDFQNRGARIVDDDLVTTDVNPLIAYRVISAAAVAAGRASPQIRNDNDLVKLTPKKAPSPEEAEARGELILLAEDNVTNQDVIRRQIGMLGYACRIVNNGEEALAEYRTGRYGLILTDCHMPVMDGYELAETIRGLEQESRSHIPIIAVTANALQGEAERCLRAGMDDYLSKPIQMAALIAVLRKWLPGQVEASLSQSTSGREKEASLPATEVPAGEAVNPRVIKDVFGDDEATFHEILHSFTDPSRAIMGEIDASQAAHAAAGIKAAAHKLKSSARAIGAEALADTCESLERAGRDGAWPEIDRLAAQARTQFADVMAYIGQFTVDAPAK